MRRSMRFLRTGPLTLLLTTLALLSLPRLSNAQTGTISGTVTDSTGQGLAGAEVRVEGTQIHAMADERGHFQLTGVAPGLHTLRVQLLSYRIATQSVTVPAGGTAE